jgi:hypothetical protein
MDRITVREYITLQNTGVYDAVLPFLKPKNKLSNGRIDFNRLSYADVRKCLTMLKGIDSWEKQKDLFCLAYGITEEDTKETRNVMFDKIHKGFWNCEIDEFFSAQNYLVKAFTDLVAREQKLLKSISVNTQLWEQAGGKRLDKFSNIMPLVQLGKIYGVFPYDLQNRPYNEILTLLVLHKEENEVNNEYEKLLYKK